MWSEILLAFIEKIPGVGNILLTAVILPIAILLLTNRHQKKQKELEIKLQNTQNKTQSKENHEDKTYGALVKILFDVQMLHVSLSTPKCEKTCVDDGLEKFQSSIVSHQNDIAESQLKLKPELIDEVYKFYNKLSELIIELTIIRTDDPTLAKTSVSFRAQELALCLVNFKRIVLQTRGNDELQKMPHFEKCCGASVTDQDIENYLAKFSCEIANK